MTRIPDTFSDNFGRKGMLLLSFLAFFAVYLGFGITTNVVLVGVLFVLYGLCQSIFRSVGKALASDLVSSELQASGVGWYTATIGITGLVASIVGGQLWTRVGPAAAFFFGVGSAPREYRARPVLLADSKEWPGRCRRRVGRAAAALLTYSPNRPWLSFPAWSARCWRRL